VTLKIKSLFILSILALSVTGINGCAGFSKRKADLKMPGKEREAVPERPIFTRLTPAEGSLWTDSGKAQLFVDLRARRVGDTVTVDIVENTTSKMDANTKATRSSSVEAKIEHMLGYMRWLEEKNKRLNKDVDGELANTLFKGNLENKFDGKGSSDRSGQVTASIGAVVVKVLPNGISPYRVLRGRKISAQTTVSSPSSWPTLASNIPARASSRTNNGPDGEPGCWISYGPFKQEVLMEPC